MRPYRKAASALAVLACAVIVNFAALASTASAAELLMFVSARCPYCLAWDREVGRSYAATPEGRRAPVRHIDLDGDEAAGFAGSDEVNVTPTFILVDRGREIGRFEGYSGGRAFYKDLRALLGRLHDAG